MVFNLSKLYVKVKYFEYIVNFIHSFVVSYRDSEVKSNFISKIYISKLIIKCLCDDLKI